MGWVMMSERELNRVEVLAQVDDGRLSVNNAANMLGLTRRQIFRLLMRYRQDGASAIGHKSRGRAPNNQIHSAKQSHRVYPRICVHAKEWLDLTYQRHRNLCFDSCLLLHTIKDISGK